MNKKTMSHIAEFENGYHHVYSRGVDRCDIFRDHFDYIRFMDSVEKFNIDKNIRIDDINLRGNKIVKIFFYMLMPNHFHFVIKDLENRGIELFMRKILSGHANYFNYKHGRVGSLFGSRFKSKIIHDELYFKTLIEYIYHNPLKLIHPEYSSEKLRKGDFKLSKSDKKFLKDYPYKKFY